MVYSPKTPGSVVLIVLRTVPLQSREYVSQRYSEVITRTALGALLVHDTVTALLAPNRLARLNFILYTAVYMCQV